MTFAVSNELPVVVIFAAFLLTLVATPIVRNLAKRRSILDTPNHRSSHTEPIPRLGGVAVVIATFLGAMILVDRLDSRIAMLAAGGIIMAAFGLLDDVKSITPLQKYAPQILSAGLGAWAMRADLAVDVLVADFVITGWASVLISAFWITAYINAFNFMDGIDGLAGGVGVIIALGLTLLAAGNSFFFLLPMAAALGGFLAWNINPASIFMGDGGSQFVGYTLAVGALWWPSFDVPVLPVALVFSPFLFDTGFTLAWRLWKRQNIFHAHRGHLYQRMTLIGYSHREVTNLYVAASALGVMFAAVYMSAGTATKAGILLGAVVIALSFVAWIARRELRLEDSANRKNAIADVIYQGPNVVGSSHFQRKEATRR